MSLLSWEVILAFLSFGLYSGLTHSEISAEQLKNMTIENPKRTGLGILFFSQGLSTNTPAIQKEWILFSNKDKRTFILEDFPLDDTFDIVPIFLAFLIAYVITKLRIFGLIVMVMKILPGFYLGNAPQRMLLSSHPLIKLQAFFYNDLFLKA